MRSHITSKQANFRKYLRNVWIKRSLVHVLVRRDLKVKYAQTIFGLAWAVIQPIVAVLIYTVFFYMILKINTGAIPYPLFVLPGILAWFHFTKIIDESGTALLQNQDLIAKIDFPKLILPVSKLFSTLVEVGITLILFFLLMLLYNYQVTWKMMFFPFFLMLNILSGFAISLWLSSLTIRYRDFHHIIPFLIGFGIWITPVFYPTTIVPASMEKYMYFNPVAGTLAGYRWCLLNTDLPSWKFVYGYIPIFILMVSGFRYFIKIENDIVDYI